MYLSKHLDGVRGGEGGGVGSGSCDENALWRMQKHCGREVPKWKWTQKAKHKKEIIFHVSNLTQKINKIQRYIRTHAVFIL